MRLHVWILAAACWTTIGCALPGRAEEKRVLTEADDQKQISLAARQPFELRLPSSLGTGHSWVLGEGARVTVVKQAEESGPATPGAPGTTVFTLRADEPGTFPLELRLVQPFNKNAAPLRTFKATLLVKSP